MIEVPAYPGDGWLSVVCRLCTRPFDILVTDSTTEPDALCQACALFVELLGQPAKPTPAPRQISPTASQIRQPVPPEPSTEAPPAPLSALWEHWWSRWRESQQEELPPDSPISEHEAEASC
jgi:hypothetical protein